MSITPHVKFMFWSQKARLQVFFDSKLPELLMIFLRPPSNMDRIYFSDISENE